MVTLVHNTLLRKKHRMKRTTLRLRDISLSRMVIQRLALVLAGAGIAVLVGGICFRLVPFERFKYELRLRHFCGHAVTRLLEYHPVLIFPNPRGGARPDPQL